MRAWIYRLSVAVLLTAILAPLARAQPIDINTWKKFTLEGTIGGQIGFVFLMKLPGRTGMVPINVSPERVERDVRYTGFPLPTIRLKGKVDRKYLDRGMHVRFTAPIADKKVQGQVKKLTVVGHDPDRVDGAFKDEDASDTGAIPEGSVRMIVTGRLKRLSSRTGEFTVYFDGGTIDGKIAEDAEVQIDSADLKTVRVGDPIVAKGRIAPMGTHFATEVNIYKGEKPIEPDDPPAVAALPADDKPAGAKLPDDKPAAAAKPKGPVKYQGAVLRLN